VKTRIRKAGSNSTHNGQSVDLYVLTNKEMVAKVLTYGGILTELQVPDRDGELNDIVLGFDDIDRYMGNHPYFGAIIGRFANRIAKGKFTLDGKDYRLATNDGPNHLHGGLTGFDKVVWHAKTVQAEDCSGVELSYLSPDGEEGYPGNLFVTVTYTLSDMNDLKLEYAATSDKPTPVNLTNHGYFNLAGTENSDILGHELMLAADEYTPVDDSLIPTGEIKTVESTPLDFREPTAIGARIMQIGTTGGYDYNYVLKKNGGLALAARVHEPTTGRVMEVFTTQPAVQFYTGNLLDGSIRGKKGVLYKKYHGFCLETQHFPDSVNHPNFPNTILRPGERYHQTTVHRFYAK
jgi:aldose 1-epimerase